jgi:hypothetical protein
MKLITSVNNHPEYYSLIIPFIKHHKRICPFLDVIVIYISDSLTDELQEYKDNIILFNPVEDVSTKFQSQHLRLYYPALFNDDEYCILTDVDLFIMGSTLFNIIEKNKNNNMINFGNLSLRECINGKHLPFCFTIVKPKLIREVLEIDSEDSIRKLVKFNSEKYSDDWFADQIILFEKFYLTNKCIKVDCNNWLRLDRASQQLKQHPDRYYEMIRKDKYIDFHCNRISSGKDFIEKNDMLLSKVSPIVVLDPNSNHSPLH